jgi:hypothetical protein
MTLNDPQEQRASRSIFANPLLYSSIALGVAAVAVVWIMFSRWQQNRYIERRALEEKSHKQRESDRIALNQLGGKELAIQSFYASPSTIPKGENVQLCYGVANATTVTLDPQTNPVWPSYARCVTVSPAKTTTYTLTITDASGNSKTQSLTVTVK